MRIDRGPEVSLFDFREATNRNSGFAAKYLEVTVRRRALPKIAIAMTIAALTRPGRALDPPRSDPALAAKLDAIFGQYGQAGTPGCAVGIRRGDAPAFAAGYGAASLEQSVPITADTVFDIGSAAKQFTAASVVLLEEDGKLSLDDPLSRFVPELPEWSRRTTLSQLLHHTSGIRDYTDLLSLAGARVADVTTDREALDILARQKGLDFEPGTKYSYSNSGYFLLSIVVSRAAGKPFPEFTAERIFRPLGMTSTRFVPDHRELVLRRAGGYAKGKSGWRVAASDWEQNGDGVLQTTVLDLLRWDENFDDPRVGGRRLVEELTTPGRLASGEPIDYALALRVDTDGGLRRVRHGGSWAGFKAEFLKYPERRVTVVTLCNFREATPSRYARAAARLLIPELPEREKGDAGTSASRAPTPAPSRPALDAARAAAYAGSYYSDELDTIYSIAWRGSALVLTRRGAEPERLTPAGEREFESEELGTLRFSADSRGKITGFSIPAGGSRISFAPVALPRSPGGSARSA